MWFVAQLQGRGGAGWNNWLMFFNYVLSVYVQQRAGATEKEVGVGNEGRSEPSWPAPRA